MKSTAPVSQSLLSKILLFSVLFATILTVVIGFSAFFLVRQVISLDVRDTLTAIAIVKENSLNRWVDEQRRNIVLLASLPDVREQAGALSAPAVSASQAQQAAENLQTYFRTVISTTSDYQEILLVNAEGKVVASSFGENLGKDQSGEEYFHRGLTQTWVTQFYTSSLLGTTTITISTPVFDSGGKRAGVLATHLNLNEIDRLIRERTGLGESGEVYLVDANHKPVTIDPLAAENGVYLSSQGIDAALRGESASGAYPNDRGIAVIGAYRWVEEHNVALLVEIGEKEALRATQTLSQWIMLAGLGVILVSNLLLVLFARRAIAPVISLTEIATQITAGNLQIRAPITSQDEIGKLAVAFNTMTTQLQKSLSRLEDLNNQLEARVEERTLALQKSNSELEAFSYSVSHDLRAPLRAIRNYAHMSLEKLSQELDAESLRWLRHIHHSALSMSEMVDGLLAFSRMGRQSMRPRRVLAEEAQEMVQKVIAEHSAEKNAPAPEIQVGNLHGCYADPILLQQVFTNLLTNAIKFSRKTTPAQVEVGSLETPQGSAYFVRDNGVGFDMQYAEKLFKVFQRLHSQEEFEGTGVGLAIIQRIVQRHRGEIWFHAEPGKGATFYFTIPLQEGDEI